MGFEFDKGCLCLLKSDRLVGPAKLDPLGFEAGRVWKKVGAGQVMGFIFSWLGGS